MMNKLSADPYEPWHVKPQDFPEKGNIESIGSFLLRYALLAPSSHNMQPWKFEVKKNIIKIFPDYSRKLAYSDRANRELYISLGCSLANLLVAANYFNISTAVDYFPEDDLRDPAIKVTLSRGNTTVSTLQALFPFITERKTNRLLPVERKIENNILEDLRNINQNYNIKLHLITDNDKKKKISEIMYDAIMYAFNDNLFKYELSHWVCSVFTKRHDGIALFDANLPSFVTLLAPILIKNAPAKRQAMLDRLLVQRSSALLIITADSNDKITWIKVGVLFELIALKATAFKITSAPMAGIIEHEKSNYKLQKVLATTQIPLFFARLCYPSKDIHVSPRRGLEEILSTLL